MTDQIKLAADYILSLTLKRGTSLAASQKREVYEVGKAFIAALVKGGDDLKAIKRSEIATAYMESRVGAGLEPESFSYWLKSAQVFEAMPSASFYNNLSQHFSISAIFELAPLSKPKNFSVKIEDIVAHLIDQKLFKSTEVRAYVRTCRKVQAPKKADTKKPIKTDKGVAMARQIAKEVLKQLSPADPETKTVSLQDAIDGKCTKAQAQAKLADCNTILSAMASAK